MKRLLVMRHAKSDWSAGVSLDHDRPLNRRGTKAARRMGRLLTEIDEVPELTITSSAVRARHTAELAAEAGAWGTPVEVEPDLYGTSVEGTLAVVAGAAESVDRLMIVGHQPTWGGVVFALTGASVQMKTATVAIVELMLGRSWESVEPPMGELAALLQPRHFTHGPDNENR